MQAPHSPQDLLPTHLLLGQEGFFVEDRSAQDATARAGAVQHHGALRRARDCGEQVTGEPSWGPTPFHLHQGEELLKARRRTELSSLLGEG